jgi:hypothetical protein
MKNVATWKALATTFEPNNDLMKRCILFILFTAASMSVQGQWRLSSALKQQLEHSPEKELLRVQVILNEKAETDALRLRFVQERLSTAERSRLVTQHLTTHARTTQQPILDHIGRFARQYPSLVGQVNTLWVTNVIVVETSSKLIRELAQRDDIAFMDLDDRWKVQAIEPVRAESTNGNRAEGGIEPGIEAIGARFLWNLGYTGRNRIGMILDTGIWPDHPAVSHRFLANHVPLDHAWFAYDTRFPADKTSSHGTHVTGTVMGLDPATSDTIGVAMNAYFIASDPVVSNLAFLKPLTDFLHAFEWAMNPDGDPATLDDVPDVINNSWGFQPPEDTLVCESIVADVLSAVELAGIANVFSAGNNGPDSMSIGTPNYINTGLVNTFCVGAVNGNNPEFQITNFSSRGPSPCGGEGSLLIKPEIVAPGFNVRSAVDSDGYSAFSGTSMASPHVSGGILLLKEAFPMVSGEEMLLALYNSAIDLGEEGEDNVYGMGMIDLEAAYHLLAESFDPVPPLNNQTDLAVELAEQLPRISCDGTASAKIRLLNRGQSPISGITITYGQVGQAEQTQTFNGTIASGDAQEVTLQPVQLNGIGFTEIWIRTSLNDGAVELDRFNNNTVVRLFRRTEEPLPFVENFETVTFAEDRWYLDNPDGQMTWDTVAIEGPRFSMTSAHLDFFRYAPRGSQRDAITSPLLSISNESDSATLRFDMFYTFLHQNFADTLHILVSKDCAGSWDTLFARGGTELATHPTSASNRLPESLDEWATERLDLTPYRGETILLRFETVNRKGNHLLLDNIWVYEGSEPTGLGTADADVLSIYPNPTQDAVRIGRLPSATRALFTLLDTKGRTVRSGQLDDKELSLSGLPAGLYMLRIQDGGQWHTLRIVKSR